MVLLRIMLLMSFSFLRAQEMAQDVSQNVSPSTAPVISLPALEKPHIEESFEMPAMNEHTGMEQSMEHMEQFEEMAEPAGIDTVSLEDGQGNWLFKRIWWERAQDLYEKIRERVNAVWESRTRFFVQRNELDRSVLDPFYMSIGMGQGELQIILNELEDFFHKERERTGDLSSNERSLYEVLEEEQESFKQLKLDVESISKLDHAIDDALGVLMDQINRARQLEKQAWDNFKEIAHVLNDIKARELYYLMDGAGRNIKNINTYLEKDFANHFSRLISEAKKHVTRVQDQIKSLKEKGVDFKRQVDRIAQQEEQERQRALEQQAQEEQEEVKPKPKQGWVDWAMSLPIKIWDYLVSLVKWPYDLIFGGKK